MNPFVNFGLKFNGKWQVLKVVRAKMSFESQDPWIKLQTEAGSNLDWLIGAQRGEMSLRDLQA